MGVNLRLLVVLVVLTLLVTEEHRRCDGELGLDFDTVANGAKGRVRVEGLLRGAARKHSGGVEGRDGRGACRRRLR